mmetsp:Transcript_10910/g.12464  ORF Transcript_10910/g.12464 Transcript_10910/m.12464 type:complete len:341 (+) Transcript_10910:237-1259(+)
MKAVFINSYGSSKVLEYTENAPIPKIKTDQVLVHVKAASINPIDIKIRQGSMHCFIKGSNFPKVLGYDIAGTVVGVGELVKEFKVGDKVFGMLGSMPERPCKELKKDGSYAEYVATHAGTLCLMPSNLSYVEAAGVPLAALTAYQALMKPGNLAPGARILINGASGGVGTFAVQIAKAIHAHVTAVASGKNRILLKSLGADRIIDYETCDFTKEGLKYDVVYDVVSNRKFCEIQGVLTPKGAFVTNSANFHSRIAFPLFSPILQIWGFNKMYAHVWVQSSGRDLSILRQLIELGQIKPVISATFPLKNAKLAHDYVETSNKKFGKVVLDLDVSGLSLTNS